MKGDKYNYVHLPLSSKIFSALQSHTLSYSVYNLGVGK